MAANSQKKPSDRDFSLADDDPLAELTRIIGLDNSSRADDPADEPVESHLAEMLDASFVPMQDDELLRDPQEPTTESPAYGDNEPNFDFSGVDDPVETESQAVTEGWHASPSDAAVSPENSDQEAVVSNIGPDDFEAERSELDAPEPALSDESSVAVEAREMDDLDLILSGSDLPASRPDEFLQKDGIEPMPDASHEASAAGNDMEDVSLSASSPDEFDIDLDANDLDMTEFDESNFFDERPAEAEETLTAAEFDEEDFANAFDAALREDLADADQAEAPVSYDEMTATAGDEDARAVWETLGAADMQPGAQASQTETAELTEILDSADASNDDHLSYDDAVSYEDTSAVSEDDFQFELDGDGSEAADDRSMIDHEDEAMVAVVSAAAYEAYDSAAEEPVADVSDYGDPEAPEIETRVYDEAVVPATEPLDLPELSSGETNAGTTLQEDALADEFADILRAEGMTAAPQDVYAASDDDAENLSADADGAIERNGNAEWLYATAAADPAFDVSQLSPAEDSEDFRHDFADSDQRLGALPPSRGSSFSRYGLYGGVALAVLLLAGGGYAYFSGGESDGDVAIVRADSEPVKVKPAESTAAKSAVAENEVYETVEGRDGEQPRQDQLVDTTEQPLEIASKDETRIAAEDVEGGTADRPNVVSIEPRKVRTFIVKPDGSIVPRGASSNVAATGSTAAGATAVVSADAAEKAANPDAGALAPDTASASAASTIDENGGANDQSGLEVALAPASGDASTESLASSATEAAAAEAVDDDPDAASIAAQIVEIPLPQVRPNVGRVTPQQTASVENTQASASVAQAPVAETTSSGATPAAWVQISSHPSREAAQVSYTAMSQRYGSLLSGRGVNIVPADIPGRGTYYRVNISASSFSDAQALCGQIKSAGGDCLPRR
ncbi:SPOR domain-containing protein [Notoacmeibacter ruber]|uniref:Uncharacterized protein n=1 Tax=Notoacmeibacter ruber TaxID=2670375 RepID=A0A3L7JBK9_9HYPH|nr:SPOR domain-containing protein [Notoacmeibacter ruber]RLQ88016.1 hypothetical protein D8780_07130 [Notoacmeibacter ruber]